MNDLDRIFHKIVCDGNADYGILLQCWLGIPGINTKISHTCLEEFFMRKLEEDLTPREQQLVIEMTSIILIDTDNIIAILEELCEIVHISESVSIRKWRCYLLEDLIFSSDPDSFYSLIWVSEFWMQWQDKLSDEIPHIYQSVGNDISPEEYYSQENITQVLQSNSEWVSKEKEFISSMSH
jgi:hypothetical protein